MSTVNQPATRETKENFITITNTILPNFNFAKHDNKEFHVFSESITDPSDCDGDWLAINSAKSFSILTDPKTMKKIKGNKIHWNFDKDQVLISAKVFVDWE